PDVVLLGRGNHLGPTQGTRSQSVRRRIDQCRRNLALAVESDDWIVDENELVGPAETGDQVHLVGIRLDPRLRRTAHNEPVLTEYGRQRCQVPQAEPQRDEDKTVPGSG